MSAVAGADRTSWHDRIGLFGPGSPMANEAGIEAMTGPRDYAKVKRDLATQAIVESRSSCWRCPATVYSQPLPQVGTDQLRKAGMNVELQTMDFATMFRRRRSKEPREKGGWNVFFTVQRRDVQCQSGHEYRAARQRQIRDWTAGRTVRGWRRCTKPGWRPRTSMPRRQISEQMQL